MTWVRYLLKKSHIASQPSPLQAANALSCDPGIDYDVIEYHVRVNSEKLACRYFLLSCPLESTFTEEVLPSKMSLLRKWSTLNRAANLVQSTLNYE